MPSDDDVRRLRLESAAADYTALCAATQRQAREIAELRAKLAATTAFASACEHASRRADDALAGAHAANTRLTQQLALASEENTALFLENQSLRACGGKSRVLYRAPR
jgi:cell division septum initiation protein DivIVA